MNPILTPIIADDINHILSENLPWSQLNGSTICISGAAGFLPAYLVETLATLNSLGAGIRIIGLVRNLEKAKSRLGHLSGLGLELWAQDITATLRTDLPKADYIVHAASQASPRFYGTDPVGTLEANTLGTQQLLRHAHHSKSSSFLFFSSGEVYGAPNTDKRLTEHDYGYLDPTDVRSCYGESKRLGETMCVSWWHQYKVPARIVRPFHTYGPGMALDDGRVFADFVSDILAKRDIVLKSDGLALRPFCYLADATAGFFTALLKGEPGLAYNIGNPEAEISIKDLASLLVGLFPELGLQVRHLQPNGQPNGYLKSQVSRSLPDITRIGQLGWQPKTSIADGFMRTINAMR
jgi:UDP-glucuronate decarboxylase